MITTGLDEVAEMLNVLLEAEMGGDKASSGNGVYVNDVGVQTNGTSECSAFEASEKLGRELFVRITRKPRCKIPFPCTRLGVSAHCVFVD